MIWMKWLLIILGGFLYELSPTYGVRALKKELRCLQPLIPYVGFRLESGNTQLQEAVFVLFEKQETRFYLRGDMPSIGELLLDLDVNPSQNAFLQSHFHRVYRLNPLSSWILTLTVLKASLSDVSREYLREKWADFFKERASQESDEQEQNQMQQRLVQRLLDRPQSENDALRNPYIDSLISRDAFGTVTDPHYQTLVTLKMNPKDQVMGILSYKQGDARVEGRSLSLEDSYIFFETQTRIYVFQVGPLHHLSANVLVFEKRSLENPHNVMTNDLYYEYFRGLRSYFQSLVSEMDMDMISLILDGLSISPILERNSLFIDQLIYRLMDVQQTFNLPQHFYVPKFIERYYVKADDKIPDLQISTILKMAYELNVSLRLFLSHEDLRPHVKIDPIRPPLSRTYIFEFERVLREKLKKAIEESGLTLSQLARASGVKQNTIEWATMRWTPKYLTLKQILAPLGRDVNSFLIEVANQLARRRISPFSPDENQNQEDIQAIAFIGDRINQAISLAGFDRIIDAKNILNVNKSGLGRAHLKLKTLLRASYRTNASLSLLVSEDPLEDHIDPQTARQSNAPEDYISKASQLVVYYIKRKMKELNFSIRDLASASGLEDSGVRAFLNHRQVPTYLSLRKLAKGLNTTLPELVKDLETDIARFDQLDLHIEIPSPRSIERSEDTINEAQRIKERIVEALRLTNIPHRMLKTKFRLEFNRLRNQSDTQIRTIYKVIHVTGLSEAQLLGHGDLSRFVNPDRYKDTIIPISNQQIEQRMRKLGQNIRNHYESDPNRSLRPEMMTYLRTIIDSQSRFSPSPRHLLIDVLQLAEDMNAHPVDFFKRRSL